MIWNCESTPGRVPENDVAPGLIIKRVSDPSESLDRVRAEQTGRTAGLCLR